MVIKMHELLSFGVKSFFLYLFAIFILEHLNANLVLLKLYYMIHPKSVFHILTRRMGGSTKDFLPESPQSFELLEWLIKFNLLF
jgi:hypothetical protein